MTIIAAGTGFSALQNEERDALAASLRRGEYNLFLGSGTSLDAKNKAGAPLPSGTKLRDDLCALVGISNTSTLQRAYGALTPEQVNNHVTNRFLDCEPGVTVAKIPSFVWRRIFTLNIDDVLEAAYRIPGHLQTARPYHFKDSFEEARTLEDVPVIHLHGRAIEPAKGYVFARSEYARVMAEANAWMTVLADIMPIEPFIVGGSALDEIDLDFYLARRSSTSAREDRGPSFFVKPDPDSQTEKECSRYGLIFYHGTMAQFLDDLEQVAPERTPPSGLVPAETIKLFPAGTSKNAILSFASDFERVPAHVTAGGEATKFSYGNPPEWIDLAANWDVGRSLTIRARPVVEAMLATKLRERVLLISEGIGKGKSTVLRRVAYDLATQGTVVLSCSALSRIDPRTTASALDLIDQPLAIVVDNFADQATAIAATLNSVEKEDLVFICAERGYRERHIIRALGEIRYRIMEGLDLNATEARQLVESYVKRGIAGSPDAVRNAGNFAKGLVGEPIAVACCHILNDMRPLDAMVKSAYAAASEVERTRYLVATLAEFCFSGGVRYEVLASIAGRENWDEQFNEKSPLPLSYSDGSRKGFVIPLNATLGEHTLDCAPAADVLRTFEKLAMGISARVNRNAIKMRSPEARLAGRLFDYEDVLSRFLKDGAGTFYADVQAAWQWNSRYWEQVALYHLAKYRKTRDDILLTQAIRHARHAVSIENHSFPLTTLGKVLLVQMGAPNHSATAAYSEAHSVLLHAIELERRHGRTSIHGYITLFKGTLSFFELRGVLSEKQRDSLRELTAAAKHYFARDTELAEIANELAGRL